MCLQDLCYFGVQKDEPIHLISTTEVVIQDLCVLFREFPVHVLSNQLPRMLLSFEELDENNILEVYQRECGGSSWYNCD